MRFGLLYALYFIGILLIVMANLKLNEWIGFEPKNVSTLSDLNTLDFYVTFISPVIIGAYIALPSLINNIIKSGTWSINKSIMFLVGIPCLLLTFYPAVSVWLATPSLKLFNSSYLNYIGVSAGYFLLKSVYKD